MTAKATLPRTLEIIQPELNLLPEMRDGNMRIRPFDNTDHDYEQVVTVDQAVWPEEAGTVENWKHWDRSRDPRYHFRRFVLEIDGRFAGIGSVGERSWAYKPGQYFMGGMLHPRYQGQGYGARLYGFLMEQLQSFEPSVEQVTAGTREDKPQAIRFLQARGFERKMRFARSKLDVTRFDPTRFAHRIEAVQASGVALKSLAELIQAEPEWLRRLYELEWELAQDVPYHDPLTLQPFDQYEQAMVENPNFYPEASYVAVDGDRWAGLSALWRDGSNPRKLNTGLTGVARDYRRRGLATALKTVAIAYAKGQGIEQVVTDNEENNPMYQLNLQLGFEPQPAGLDFVKILANGQSNGNK